jgi:hypothetical protein
LAATAADDIPYMPAILAIPMLAMPPIPLAADIKLVAACAGEIPARDAIRLLENIEL